MRMRLLFLGSRWLVLMVHHNENSLRFQDLPKIHQNSVKIIEEFFWQICLYQVAPGGGGGVGSSEQINGSKERKDFQKITNNGGGDSQSSWPWWRKAIQVQCTVHFKGSERSIDALNTELKLISEIYYQCCVLIVWATTRLYVIAH